MQNISNVTNPFFFSIFENIILSFLQSYFYFQNNFLVVLVIFKTFFLMCNNRPRFDGVVFFKVNLICEQLVRDREVKIREEYDKVLSTKLAEQYDCFVRFTADQIQERLSQGALPSCKSQFFFLFYVN